MTEIKVGRSFQLKCGKTAAIMSERITTNGTSEFRALIVEEFEGCLIRTSAMYDSHGEHEHNPELNLTLDGPVMWHGIQERY